MFGFKFLGNVNVPHYKNTAKLEAVRMTPPAEVLLPVAQHIGSPAVPVVKAGDEVKVGQLVARSEGPMSSPVYASVSGKVKKIEDYLRPDGRTVQAIRIESDGLMTEESVTPPALTDLDSFLEAIHNSGLVGLGGAGFPTAAKLAAVRSGKIDTVIINGAECEPYITGDTRTMLDDSEWIYKGISLLKRFGNGERFVIGIEKNKPDCIEEMVRIFGDDPAVSVKPLPDAYPQGAEKVLIYNTTERVVPEGGLPSDVGVIVVNVTSLAALAKYMETGMPLISRTVTVDGSAIASAKNVIVPIGTSIRDLIDFAGGVKCEIGKVLFGGPMMGIAAMSLDEPITKTTGAITVLSVKDSQEPKITACIHCGRCVAACPLSLNPTAYSKALGVKGKDERIIMLEAYKVNLCMECGCCSFVCPARRPLVQNNRLGKKELREYQAHRASLKK